MAMVAVFPSAVARISELPFATAVMRPVAETVATAILVLLHVTAGLAILFPFASLAISAACVDSPIDAKVAVGTVDCSNAIVCWTDTATEVVIVPTVAVAVVLPVPTDATTPVEVIVAIALF